MAENKTDNSKDKVKNGIIIALVLIIILGGSFFISEMKGTGSSNEKDNDVIDTENTDTTVLDAQAEATKISAEERKEMKQITVDDYLTLKDGSKASIIYIARPTCNYCTISSPILEGIAHKYDLTINYINTDEITDAESVDLVKSDDYFSEGYGTPLLLIVKNKKIVDKFEGLAVTDTYIDFFKDNGVLK